MGRDYTVDLFLKKKYAVVDVQKRTIGIFNSSQLVDFFGVSFMSLLPYIRKEKRYNLFYTIYTESRYNKLIEDGVLEKKFFYPQGSGESSEKYFHPSAPKSRV